MIEEETVDRIIKEEKFIDFIRKYNSYVGCNDKKFLLNNCWYEPNVYYYKSYIIFNERFYSVNYENYISNNDFTIIFASKIELTSLVTKLLILNKQNSLDYLLENYKEGNYSIICHLISKVMTQKVGFYDYLIHSTSGYEFSDYTKELILNNKEIKYFYVKEMSK
jgi:hypothetical protein